MKSYYEEHVEDCAAALYDGGWRSTDKEEMQQATSQIMSSSAQQISSLNQQSSQQSSSTTRGNEKGISGEGHGDIEWNPGHTARNR